MTCTACRRVTDRPRHVIERGVVTDGRPVPRDLPYCSDHCLAVDHGTRQETP